MARRFYDHWFRVVTVPKGLNYTGKRPSHVLPCGAVYGLIHSGMSRKNKRDLPFLSVPVPFVDNTFFISAGEHFGWSFGKPLVKFAMLSRS